MAIVSACPDVAVLQQLAMGRMPPHEVEHLAKHCEQCPRCIQLLHTLKVEDTLIEAMAAQSTAPHQACTDAVHSLIERLKRMPSPVPAAELSATTGAVSTPPASIETTQAGDISLAPPQAADEIGRLGGYRVLKMLGAGGMGMVYQAEDVHLQRPIALKVMKAEVAKNPGNRERFLREARAAAKLKSDHVVTIHQVGEDNQVVFLAMEYLEGMSLDDWMKKGRIPSLAQTVRIGRQIALGLADAHACGLIHRDIKPGNIWLDNRHQGRVKLLDFGLARGTADEVHLTASGAIVGTPAYMAPEQARSDKVDHRVDLFSLGVVLYRLTTGQLPFRGDNTMSILTALALDNPKPPREINADIPPRLATLIERLLSKDREQRPATAKAVADELALIEREATQPATEERTVQVNRAASASERSCSAPSRSRLRWLVAASMLFLFGGLAAAIVIIVRDPQGNKIAEINAPKGSNVEIKDDEAKANVPPKEEAKIVAPPLAPMQPGTPLSPTALVQHPAKLPGVRSWTIEKRDVTSVGSIAFRPDGKRLAVYGGEGIIRVWEPQTGRLVQVMYMEVSPNRPALAWSPDGRMLAAAPYISNGPIRLWDAETGRSLVEIKAPNANPFLVLAWTLDGRKVLAGERGAYCIWDAANGKLLHQWPTPDAVVQAFSSDGKFAAGRDLVKGDLVFIWDVATGKEVRQLTGSQGMGGWYAPVNWSTDGKHLGCGGQNGVFVWEAATGKKILHRKDISADNVTWSPDGRMWAVVPINHNWRRLVELTEEAPGRSLPECDLWSPDGKTVAGYDSWSGIVRLYDATGKRLRTLSEGNVVLSATFSSDGRTVAVAGASGITLSSTDTGQEIWRLKDTSGAFALSPDGKRLATGGPDHAVILWEDGGKVRVPLLGHRQQVSSLAWSPDGKRLVSFAEGDNRMLLWNADKGELLRESGPFPAPNPNYRMMWSADGRFLAFPAWPVNEVIWHIWDMEQNKLVNNPKEWKDTWLVFSPDGSSVLVGSYGVYRLRDRTSGKEVRSLPVAVSSDRWHPAWSPDGHLLAVPVGAKVELWRGDLLRRVRTLHSTVPQMDQVAFSPDGKWTFGRDGERLHIWETDTGRLSGILLLGEKNNGLTIAADGHYTGNEKVDRGIVVVVQKDDGTQEVLEPADFEQKYGWKNEPNKVHLLQPLPPSPYPLPGMPMGPNALVREPAELPGVNSWTIETISGRGNISVVAYRPDGKLLATGGKDGTIRLWDPGTGQLVRMLVAAPVWTLSWSADGKVLAVGCHEDGIWLWDTEAGRLLRRFPDPERGIATLSPDGRTLAVQAGAGLELMDADTGRLLSRQEFPANSGSQVPPAWSPDGKVVAVSIHEVVRLWDVASAKELQALKGHKGGVFKASWSPDGKNLVTVSYHERAFRVWDAATGKLQGRFDMACTGLRAAALSPDGKKVALGFFQGTNGLFDPTTGGSIRSFQFGWTVNDLAWSPDGKQVALVGYEGVRLHNASTGKLAHVLEEPKFVYGGNDLQQLTWSPDSRLLALDYRDGESSRIVQVATGQNFLAPASGDWQASAWSSDGKMFATTRFKAGVRLWNAETNRLVRTLDGTADMDLTQLAWSVDGKKMAAGGRDRLGVWSAETGKILWQSQKHPGYVSALAWSPDGCRLATTHLVDKPAAILWEAETGELRHQWSCPSGCTAVWSPDGKFLAIGLSPQDECLLIEATSGTVHRKFLAEGHWQFLAPRWSADGKTFRALTDGLIPGKNVRTCADGLVLRDFDTATGKVLRRTPLWLLDRFFNANWSPDGRVLAGSNNVEIHLSDGDGWPLGVLLPGDPFGQLAITADGHYRGNARVERLIRMVVQKADGTTETLTPNEFERKYGFKNEPDKVRLLDK